MLIRSVAATILVLAAGRGLAQAPADTSDLDSIQRQLDQAKAAQAAAARKKAASAAPKRKQRQAEPPPPDDAAGSDLEMERRNRERVDAVLAEQEQREAARLAAEEAAHYTAFALAWNNQGGFASARGATMEEARQTALNTCIQNNGSCYDSGMVIPPGKKYCFAVVQSQSTRLFDGIGPDIGTAQTSALSSCSAGEIGCTLKGAACNGP